MDRTFINEIFDNGQVELYELLQGHFFTCYQHQGKIHLESVFDHARLAIRRTDLPYQYQLVVLQEGSQPPDHPYGLEQAFPLTMAIQITAQPHPSGNLSITWLDQVTEETFQYIIHPTITKESVDLFLSVASECLWEAKYYQSRQHAQVKDLAYIEPLKVTYNSKSLKRMESEKTAKSSKKDRARDTPISLPGFIPPQGYKLPEDPIDMLVSVQVDVFYYHPTQETFIEFDTDVEMELVSLAPFQHWVVLHGRHMPVIARPIATSMNLNFNKMYQTITWNYQENDQVHAFLIKFEQELPYDEFCAALSQCIYEVTSLVPFAKSKKRDQNYMISSFRQGPIMDMEDDDVEDIEALNCYEEDEDLLEEVDEDIMTMEQEFYNATSGENSALIWGTKTQNAFVFRGSSIGFYKKGLGANLVWDGAFSDVIEPKSRGFLYDDEASILLLNGNTTDTITRFDLEQGSIVEEWKAHHEDDQLIDIAPSRQGSHDSTFIGITSSAVFRLDPRQPGVNKIVTNEYKKHLTKTDFKAMVTSSDGMVAVAGVRGDIRLFHVLNRMASTTFPPTGDPVQSLDISQDSRYILATYRHYLVLIDLHDKVGDDHPTARQLHLRSEHLVLVNQIHAFTPASFLKGPNGPSIITTAGPYVISWQLQDIIQGKLYTYRLKKYESECVISKPANSDAMVMMFKDDVQWANAHRFETPVSHHFLEPGLPCGVRRRVQKDIDMSTL
ncbi:VID27-domain-containing protein [Hesseltinella vesiculosa]|uniref:VID27-domain-containing protein n=1 Tax=Hesseltinella vesiculosa TaxID=101127 RepID=A0A1X2GQX7_9FUNG|nr:VID27-domain-containing protein [Hesseltinella vesiculosa]